jgi:orotate phosphoribosyltransferase
VAHDEESTETGMTRRLLITRRQVPSHRQSAYHAGWQRVVDSTTPAGVRAWRYRSATHADEFIEFLEWLAGRNDDTDTLPVSVAQIRDALEDSGLGEEGVWLDASPPPTGEIRQRLLALVRERSLRRGDFVLSSGVRSSYYIDARITTMSGEGQSLIGSVALEVFQGLGWAPRCVGGLTLGADPIAYAIAHTATRRGLAMDAFTVRKQAKLHGAGRRIEGAFSADGGVVIIEDVITSGDSALQAIAAVRDTGARIVGVFALVDRMEGGVARVEAHGLTVASLFTSAELLEN